MPHSDINDDDINAFPFISMKPQQKSQTWLSFCQNAVQHHLATKYIGQSIFKQDFLVCISSSHWHTAAVVLSVDETICLFILGRVHRYTGIF